MTLPSAGAATGRWRIVALLAAFSLVSYALRTNISVAAAFMRVDLHLTEVQLGQVFTAFMIGYAICQVPAGAAGDRFGPRAVLAIAAVIWGLATLMTGALPGRIAGAGASLIVLLGIRFLLGAAEAATYPVAASAVAVWMPPSDRAFSNALVIAGMALGSAFIPPLMSRAMVAWGWRTAFYLTALPAFGVSAAWWYLATDRWPAGRGPLAGRHAIHWPLLRNRNMLLICVSYFLDSYVLFIFVFWFYLYLLDQRHFSILKSGTYSSLPWVAALIVVPIAGRVCDLLSSARGPRFGRRAVAMNGLLVSSALLALGTRAENATAAIAALSLSVAFLISTEGSFWSSAADISGPYAGTAGGLMNTAGNLGGVASTSVVPLLVQRFGWNAALMSGSALGLASALLWTLIRVDERAVEPDPAGVTVPFLPEPNRGESHGTNS